MSERLCPISTETDYRKHAEAHLAGPPDRGTYCHLKNRYYWSRINGRVVEVDIFGPLPSQSKLRQLGPDEIALRSVNKGPWEFVEVWE